MIILVNTLNQDRKAKLHSAIKSQMMWSFAFKLALRDAMSSRT